MPDPLERLKTALADCYAIERELGSGGMATVYLAEDRKHHRHVAIKVLRPELAALLGDDRFLREIAIAAKLNHPHILALHDSGEADGFLYYVMPYVEGESLRARLTREKQLAIDEAVTLAGQVASALDYAHEQRVIHRDIKPENILLHGGEAVVADFGIALAVTAAGGERLTETGLSLGTPEYMSPEQATGGATLDARSDVYALGAVLYEMVTGEPPQRGATVQAVMAKLLSERPTRPRVVRDSVPEAMDRAIMKALAKVPADRFASAGQLVAALTAQSDKSEEDVKSIVVLPFENLSPDPENAYFADGLTEELIADLSKVQALRVVSRTSAMQFKGTAKGVPAIARELNVRYVLEGSVRRAGNRLRITAQLIDAATDAHIWADKYGGTLDNVFDLQERLAREILTGLRAKLTADEDRRLAARPVASTAAYDCYLRAMGAIWECTEASLARAIDHLEHGIEIEGESALLRSALAYVYYQHANIGLEPIDEFRSLAREHADRALAQDQEATLAHLALGLLSTFQNPPEGVRSLKRVLELDPNNVDARLWLALVVGLAWRPDAGRVYLEAARALDPLHPLIDFIHANLFTMSGDFERATQVLRSSLQSGTITDWQLALNLAYLSRRGEASRLFHQAFRGSEGHVVPWLCQVLRHALRDEHESAWRILRSNLHPSPAVHHDFMYALYVAECHALLDDIAGALEWLERSVELGMINFPFLNEHDPLLAPLRTEGRFQDLMERVKRDWEALET